MKLWASGLRLKCTAFRGEWIDKTAYSVVGMRACGLSLKCVQKTGMGWYGIQIHHVMFTDIFPFVGPNLAQYLKLYANFFIFHL